MEQQVEEVKAMQEQESAKKAVEEALAQERERINLLTTEIEGLKVCSSPMILLFLVTVLQAGVKPRLVLFSFIKWILLV